MIFFAQAVLETVAVITHDKKKNDSQHTKYDQNLNNTICQTCYICSTMPYQLSDLCTGSGAVPQNLSK
jgi:hypothetical protein